jgi:hypothetical protein
MEKLTIRKLGLGTLFKITFIGLVCGFVPLFTLMGILGYFGMADLTWNEQPLTGVSALVAGPFLGLFMALVFTMFIGVALGLGLFIYSKFRPLEIEYEAVD